MSGKKYQADVVAVKDLDSSQQKRMAQIYLTYYGNTDETLFFRDLHAKDSVVLLYNRERLAGFSTLLFYSLLWEGRSIRIVYSGDTIVCREDWGQQALPAAWLRHMGQLYRRDVFSPLYWFLLVKGHRTYKFLPAFAYEYYPDPNSNRPELKRLADALAMEKFGADYNRFTGVVEFERSLGNLKDDIAHPGERELKNPFVRFFLRRNPGYLEGHELVCLCRIAPDNLKPFAQRIFEEEIQA